MSNTRPRRILFVGMADSPHTAKWIQLVADQGWELHFFPVNLVCPNTQLGGVLLHQPWKRIYPRQRILKWAGCLFGGKAKLLSDAFRTAHAQKPLYPLHTKAMLPLCMVAPLDRLFGSSSWLFSTKLGESPVCAPRILGPNALKRIIKKVKPDLIHSMEFQHAGYLVLRTKELMPEGFPSWLATNWGSDIYYYQHFPDHRQQLIRLLEQIDYYSCECERDVGLAKALGTSAEILPVLPNTGGFVIPVIQELRSAVPPSRRKLVMVKGYQHFAGRALTALDALAECATALQGYEVVLFSVNADAVSQKAKKIQKETGIAFTILPYVSHPQVLQYLSQARIYLGVSVSDAISTSMLEAMAMGAFPIQTNTSCCHEWIEDGITGFSIPVDDVAVIRDRVLHALRDGALVDMAAEKNWYTVCERLDADILKTKEVAFYDQAFSTVEAT